MRRLCAGSARKRRAGIGMLGPALVCVIVCVPVGVAVLAPGCRRFVGGLLDIVSCFPRMNGSQRGDISNCGKGVSAFDDSNRGFAQSILRKIVPDN